MLCVVCVGYDVCMCVMYACNGYVCVHACVWGICEVCVRYTCVWCSLVPRPFPPPVFDRLQCANTEGKAWEIWSCAVTSCRQKIDTQGRCPTRNLEALSCTIGLRAGGQSISKAVSIPSVVHSTRNGSTRNGNYYCQAPPPCVSTVYHLSIPDVTTRDQIS